VCVCVCALLSRMGWRPLQWGFFMRRAFVRQSRKPEIQLLNHARCKEARHGEAVWERVNEEVKSWGLKFECVSVCAHVCFICCVCVLSRSGLISSTSLSSPSFPPKVLQSLSSRSRMEAGKQPSGLGGGERTTCEKHAAGEARRRLALCPPKAKFLRFTFDGID